MRGICVLTVLVNFYTQFVSAGYVGFAGFTNTTYKAANLIELAVKNADIAINNVLLSNTRPDGSIHIQSEQEQLPALTAQGKNVAEAVESALKLLEKTLHNRMGTSKSASDPYYVSDMAIQNFDYLLDKIISKMDKIANKIKTLQGEYDKLSKTNITKIGIQTIPDNQLKTIKTTFKKISDYIRNVGFIFQVLGEYIRQYESTSSVDNENKNPFLILSNAVAKVCATVANDISEKMNRFYKAMKFITAPSGVEMINVYAEYSALNVLLKHFEKEGSVVVNFLQSGKKVLREISNQ